MPGLIVERPKMSLQMHETLKRYILKERKKKKDEDVAHEEKLREELRKAEMTTHTLEQNKEQLKLFELKLEDLQLKKRDLFNQLKKVLNEETTLKKKPMLVSSDPSIYQSSTYPVMFQPPPMKFIQNNRILMQQQQHTQQSATSQQSSPNMKRHRSPSPTLIQPSSIYQSPQHHQNLLSSVVSSLSPVTVSSSQLQPGSMISPNKRGKIISTPLNAYSSLILPQSPQPQARAPMAFNLAPPQSAFSSYSSSFPTSPSFKQQQSPQPNQQKSPLVNYCTSVGGLMSTSQPSSLPYGLLPRLPNTNLQGQIDAQKLYFPPPPPPPPQQHGLQQSGSIMTGYPLMQKQSSQQPPPPFN